MVQIFIEPACLQALDGHFALVSPSLHLVSYRMVASLPPGKTYASLRWHVCAFAPSVPFPLHLCMPVSDNSVNIATCGGLLSGHMFYRLHQIWCRIFQ